MEVFQFNTAIEIINHIISNGKPEIPHGAKNKLAKTLNCHPTYVAQILKGSVCLSQEQGIKFCESYYFDERQTEYFLTLLNLERAGSHSLKKYYEDKKRKILSKIGPVGKSINSIQLDDAFENEFFTNWDFQAIHSMIILFDGIKNINQITEFLGINLSRVEYIIKSLEKFDIIERTPSGWISKNNKIHFNGKNEDIRQKFHLTWRMKSIEKNFISSERNPSQFNFSSILTLDQKTFDKTIDSIKSLIKGLSKNLEDIDPDSICVLNIDLFEMYKK